MFLEVDTPILHPVHGGANAQPFKTYYASLKRHFYLRISNELYLKRVVIGNLERVFEFSRDFRNEGIDSTHSPEFTLLEIYEAYRDYRYCMKLTEKLIVNAARAANGRTTIGIRGTEVDLSAEWTVVKLYDLVREFTGVDASRATREMLLEYLHKCGLPTPRDTRAGALIEKMFSRVIQPHLIMPTFVIDYPVDISPLAKCHNNDAKIAERFELYIGGIELANGYSELNDPVEQLRRFALQRGSRSRGGGEDPPIDREFVLAQEYGMPPTAGVGIGIDRLVMILTGVSNIRDVMLFPQLKEER
jgi:lysyl-tRNA synthetase class 2